MDLSGIAAGDYLIEATRWLTVAERNALSPSDPVVGFVTTTTIRLPSTGSIQLTVPASRRNGLVISEWGHTPIYSPGTGSYEFGGFIEIANNGDTTAFLDGVLLGEGWTQGAEFANRSCATVASVTNDPSGVWVRKLAQFPGSGRDYPVVSGAVVVVATDAIDHRPLTPGGLDLTTADFEFIGPVDVDNPAVPNMKDVGLSTSFFGHGMDFDGLWSVPFLAKGLDVATLARQRPAFFTDADELIKIPVGDILDAAALLSEYEFPTSLCPRLVNVAIDRRTARLFQSVDATTQVIPSVHRIKPAGRSFFQDTRTSGADFVAGPRTPGREP